jgi:hypothetical protein
MQRGPLNQLLARLLVASEIATDLKLQELIDESNQLIAIFTSIIKATRKNA